MPLDWERSNPTISVVVFYAFANKNAKMLSLAPLRLPVSM
jgi:hypothetical protein